MRIALLALLVGCTHGSDGPGVIGSPTDVSTTPGTYAGYRVVSPCPSMLHATLGVIGTGSVALSDDSVSQLGLQLERELTDLPSIWGGGGIALGCEPGVSTSLMLDDWRDVDTVIDRAGAFLKDHDLALQVSITVSSVPVPD
jgi:hypothetical protein